MQHNELASIWFSLAVKLGLFEAQEHIEFVTKQLTDEQLKRANQVVQQGLQTISLNKPTAYKNLDVINII